MDYAEYMVKPEELEFERADAEQQRALRMINERDKAAMIVALVMVGLMGIIAPVILFKLVGAIAAIVAIVTVLLLLALVVWYLKKVFPQKGYYDFEIVRVQVVSVFYHAGELREVDLWSEDQQKCVHYDILRNNNHISKDVQGYFVRGTAEGRKDFFFVTDSEYKIMKMNADQRKNG